MRWFPGSCAGWRRCCRRWRCRRCSACSTRARWSTSLPVGGMAFSTFATLSGWRSRLASSALCCLPREVFQNEQDLYCAQHTASLLAVGCIHTETIVAPAQRLCSLWMGLAPQAAMPAPAPVGSSVVRQSPFSFRSIMSVRVCRGITRAVRERAPQRQSGFSGGSSPFARSPWPSRAVGHHRCFSFCSSGASCLHANAAPPSQAGLAQRAKATRPLKPRGPRRNGPLTRGPSIP